MHLEPTAPQRHPDNPSPPTGHRCERCGHPGADHFVNAIGAVHRACVGLEPDVLAWPWILLAYAVVVPLGFTFIGALLASLPYYLWRASYPRRAAEYNRHVWIGFALSCTLWISAFVISTWLKGR